ncbi:DUF5999 family protein [Streptomyces anulatus]
MPLPNVPTSPSRGCAHQPPCPTAKAADHGAARLVGSFPEQGWSRLCNSVVRWEDTGELLPSGQIVEPNRMPTMSTGRNQTLPPHS